MDRLRVSQAAINNAHWCNNIAMAHGIPGRFRNDYWMNTNRMPPFYPNLVTISSVEDDSELIRDLHQIRETEELKTCAVKDSFMELDLTTEGLQILFEASWIWLSPEDIHHSDHFGDARYTAVKNELELNAWELVWEKYNQHDKQFEKIFVNSLLMSVETTIIAGKIENVIKSGAIAFITDNIVGITNFFSTDNNRENELNNIIELISKKFPKNNIVGYEYGENLQIAKALGFQEIGNLRIWI